MPPSHFSFFFSLFLSLLGAGATYLCSHSAQYPTLLFRIRTSRFDSARSESPLRRLRNPPRFVIVTQFRANTRERDEICSTNPRLRTLSARVLLGYLRYFGIAEYRLFEENTPRNAGLTLRKEILANSDRFLLDKLSGNWYVLRENRIACDIYGILAYSMGALIPSY